jgi:lantibiotic leader peptide-processing serine protease
MRARIHPWLAAASAAVLVLGATVAAPTVAAADGKHPGNTRWMVVAKSDGDFGSLRADIVAAGGRILNELPATNTFVVSGGANVTNLATDSHVSGVAADHLEKINPPDSATKARPLGQHKVNLGHSKVTPDPAFALDGLMWNVNRVNAPKAWKTTTGSAAVTVGVADTGLDYTHSELAGKVSSVVDLTDPTLCTDYFGASDADFAAAYGGPADTDWNGHGTWIGGNIAAALDGVGINGIAPGVNLVALKISEWCGYAYDTSILAAFQYAADHGINIVSISFGGYLDLSDPDQATIYKQYVQTVAYAMRKGTLIVAAAGNEHVRIGAGGKVLSHGQLWTPGDVPDPVNNPLDLYGLYETPGGIPGVVMVSATNNVVNKPTKACDYKLAGTYPSLACKASTDAHQPAGIGRLNQLAYYSNYGPRIDVAAPGGARKFNLPAWDGGGTPGWPVTEYDGYAAWQDFSITSNWAFEIPCYYLTGPQFYPGECYSTIQGTSMATPHASAVAAFYASAYPRLRHNAWALAATLKATAAPIRGNATQPLSATDLSVADLAGFGAPTAVCDTGFCHLGGRAISDAEAYGAGLVSAAGIDH